MDVDLNALPIPDWGLECPRCRYPLRGLPEHRCPECGHSFRVADIVRSWHRLVPPRYTGGERPLPDFGLRCGACHAPLAGARSDSCPACAEPFDVSALRPRGEYFNAAALLPTGLPASMFESILQMNAVPYHFTPTQSVMEVYGLRVASGALLVPREYYFDVRKLIEEAKAALTAPPPARAAQPPTAWTCTRCGESNPATFEVCWRCEAPGPGGESNDMPAPGVEPGTS